MNARAQRGEVLTIILVVVGLAAATQLVPNWRLSNLFKKAPPTKELIAAEAAAIQARAEATAAREALAKIQEAARVKQAEQVGYAQEMIAGVPLALKAEPQTAGVRLATNLAQRAGSGLAAAIGDLPTSKQAEITAIVEQALSGKQAEIDAANRALAAKDAELRIATLARTELEARVPVLQQAKEAAEAKVEVTAAVASKKAAEVAEIATKLFAEQKEKGSLGAMVTRLGWAAIVLGVLATIGFIAWQWAKFELGKVKGIPGAMAAGLKELRAKGVLPLAEESNVFDAHLNRSEQAAIRKASL
jgi:hypothetical protein